MTGTRDDEKRVPEEDLAATSSQKDDRPTHLTEEDAFKDDIDFESEEELGDVASAKAKLQKLRNDIAAVKKER